MEFTGRLAVFPASNLLQWALTERVTGTLVVRRSQREKRIGFRNGKILDCRLNQASEYYGQHLVAGGILGGEELGKALAHCRLRRLPLGETLWDLGLLDEHVRHCVTHTEGRDGTEDPDDTINEAMQAFERLLRT